MPDPAFKESCPVLEARDLGKVFGLLPILSGIALSISAGETVVVVGGNGAGKSTLLEVLCGLRRPSAGRAMLFGHDAASLPSCDRKRLGVLTHQSFLYPDLTATENLVFYGCLYGIEVPEQRAHQWLGRIGLGAAANQRVRALSRGMEQRLAIARAMLPNPELLILDEPFAALDNEGAGLVHDLLTQAGSRGCATLLTSHSQLEISGVSLETYELAAGRLISRRQDERLIRSGLSR